ncbi:hypothetical protein HanRHA438_Chr00c70g0862321 [Helianthus annuus]|nr:hypothetical protein HanRHA438_Chr00c70g0862321 [Helianthus annuus]
MSKKVVFIPPGVLTDFAYSLWSLLPSFCNYPVDTAESFKDLEKVLCHTLAKKPISVE